ncbi:heterokaryon incompatibility protein-domain-containing protein [Fusarium oxysporum f. sp. albedinis]|nr:heterokaryon incompatibility protein-domain-containing protein [Fusarium oxysporum f. sp. albedinis]KAK2469185.1 hypothetical protein H9L39_19166 [Fusarium oxysporum f. sp. albedinis]
MLARLKSLPHGSSEIFDPTRQIRVLVVDPGKPPTPITATFRFVTLKSSTWQSKNQNQEWNAVSYVWGNQSPLCRITVDGLERRITQNVFRILWELRHPVEKMPLWIDALCINQDDNKEKNIQVAMMRQVYQNARSVIVWLCADPDEASRCVVDAVQWLDKGLDECSLAKKEPLLTCFRQQSSDSYCLIPFQRVLKLPWFERIWVVQEAAFARNLLVYLDGRILPWEPLFSGILRFMSYLDAKEAVEASLSRCYSASRDTGDVALLNGLTMVNLIVGFREWLRDSHFPIPPSGLVAMCRGCQATEAVDMIYGVSAFFGLKESSALLRRPFPVNYDVPVAEVYQGFTIWCLQNEKCLDVLAQQRHETGENGGLPTWATNWAKLSTCDFNVALRRTIPTKKIAPLSPLHAPKFRTVGSTLILRGYIIDTFERSDSFWIDNYDDWLKCIPSDPTANRILFGEEVPTVETLKRIASRTKENDTLCSHLWRDGTSLASHEQLRWRIKRLTSHGLLAVTFSHFHDPPVKICTFYGGRSLFLLRPVGYDELRGKTKYGIISGECLIDGFENGKGVYVARKLGLEEMEIHIV